MVITDYARSGLSLLMAGSSLKPEWCAIGSGSGIEVASVGSLYNERLSERNYWTSRSIAIARETSWVFDFNSVTMSGTFLSEFGIGIGSTIGVQDLWSHETFPSIECDGTVEIQVEVVFQVF